jgi:hypothetical protein
MNSLRSFAITAVMSLTMLASADAQIGFMVPSPPPAEPPPPPLGWVYTRYTVCPEPRSCPVVFVSVAADGLNVRGPDGNPVMALVNGTPLLVLDRQGPWTLVAAACDLTPTWLWSWTARVPLNRCFVWYP